MTVMNWLVAAAVFVVIEIMTMGLTTIWFAGGALVGAVMAAVSLPLWSQIIAFAVISVILLILTRPWGYSKSEARIHRRHRWLCLFSSHCVPRPLVRRVC